jgi:hypothetical protein
MPTGHEHVLRDGGRLHIWMPANVPFEVAITRCTISANPDIGLSKRVFIVNVMWTYEHHQTTTATTDAIWSLYADVTRWPEWDDAMERVDLDGPFDVGISGVMHVKDFGPVPFTLTMVDAPRRFVTSSPMEGFDVIFDHRIETTAASTTITHEVRIEGPASDVVGPQMGPNITTDIPHTIAAISELALNMNA